MAKKREEPLVHRPDHHEPGSPDSQRYPKREVTDFQLVLRTICLIFFACAILAVLVAGLDAFRPVPLADFLVKKFGEILGLCIAAIGGLFAGRRLTHSTTKGP